MDTPDLQSILANLARYTTPAQPTQASYSSYSTEDSTALSLGYPQTSPALPDVTDSGAPPGPVQFGPISQPLADRTEDPRLRPQSHSTATASPKPVIDPATITTWKDGLRCVQKIAEQNKQFAASIRKVRSSCYFAHEGLLMIFPDDKRSRKPRAPLVLRTTRTQAHPSKTSFFCSPGTINLAITLRHHITHLIRSNRDRQCSRTFSFRPENLFGPAIHGNGHDRRAEKSGRALLRH